ncbi:hypothetical protein HGRIS_014370 [Hohenbuehelia grisea]|uniref:DUF6534 domain-containing protein n=1 Tax=Hohenbuehelia grisea TaxID=104357 RepID=A0ABR3JUM6_9AGAR
MVYLLRGGPKSKFNGTRNLIARLIVYTVGAGFVTSVVACLNLVLFLALPQSFAWAGPHYLVGRLYINSFLVNLNSRVKIREQRDKPQVFALGALKNSGINSDSTASDIRSGDTH